MEEPPVLELPPPQPPPPKPQKKGKKTAAPKPPKPEKEEIQPPTVVGSEELSAAARTRRTSVRLTIPAQPQVPAPTVPADPNEARYCYCNQVSFGTVGVLACFSHSFALVPRQRALVPYLFLSFGCCLHGCAGLCR